MALFKIVVWAIILYYLHYEVMQVTGAPRHKIAYFVATYLYEQAL